jgi:hypothetical protein
MHQAAGRQEPGFHLFSATLANRAGNLQLLANRAGQLLECRHALR